MCIRDRDRRSVFDKSWCVFGFDLVEELRMKLSVNTARFILFLYIQNIPRLSLKTSLLTGEEYPQHNLLLVLDDVANHIEENSHVS